ncbi:MAG: HDOD domain-containing protein [Dehalococcoidia bacterium]|nr:HDOD domain-containing protein [Dehalococcoidia bacterium]
MITDALDAKGLVLEEVHRRFAQVLEDPLMHGVAGEVVECLAARDGENAPRGHLNLPFEGADGGAATPVKKIGALTFRSALVPILSDPAQLPSIPILYLRLSKLTQDPSSTAAQVAEVLGTDPASVTRLLRLVNSPFYGLRNPVSSVAGAVRLLGFDAVNSLVLATSMDGLFKSTSPTASARMEQLWYHSIGCAVAAKIIASLAGFGDVEQYFVAGLLHDLGKLVVLRSCPDAFEQSARLAVSDETQFADAENVVCGTNHALIGALLGNRWSLPPSLVAGLSQHHHPGQAKAHPEVAAVVHLADIVSLGLGIGSSGNPFVPPIDNAASKLLNLDADRLKAIIDTTESEYPAVESAILGTNKG